MSTYAPGTVAVATVRGVEGVRVMPRVTGGGETDGWLSSERVELNVIHHDDQVTDVRPLVVLDLGFGPRAADEAVRLLRTAAFDNEGFRALIKWLADQIEAQTKPPRIPEPGLWGVVEASLPNNITRVEFVCTKHGWTRVGGLVRETDDYAWESLIDPTLIREGVQS